MDFSTSIERVHSAVGTISWGGNNWTGVGTLGKISVLQEGVEVRPQKIKLTLSGLDSNMVSHAMDEEYHGRDVRIYRGTCDADYVLNADPDIVWSGFMDHMTITLDQGSGVIELVCENQLARWDVPRPQRFDNADQQARFAGDLFFEYQAQMQEYSPTWGGEVVRPWSSRGSQVSGGSAEGRKQPPRTLP
jgi:hypothetical protein